MNNTLIIILPHAERHSEGVVDWLLVNHENAELRSGHTPLQALRSSLDEHYEIDAVVAIAPAELSLSVSVEIPTTQWRQIKQALPFAVEDMIADEVENVHVAVAANYRTTLPSMDVLVTAHTQLIEWLDELHSHRLSPTAILVDALCLPWEGNSWTLMVDSQRVLVRFSENRGMAIQLEDFEHIFPRLLEKHLALNEGEVSSSLSPRFNVIASQSVSGDRESIKQVSRFLKKHYPQNPLKPSLYRQSPAQLLSLDWYEQKRSGINLLQGGYAVGSRVDSQRQKWGLVASVATLGVGLYLLITLGMGWYFHARTEILADQSEAVYRQLFPEARRVVNPRKQLQNFLRQNSPGSNSSFLRLLAETARQIGNSPSPPEVTLNQIRFNSEQGGLRFEVNSRSLEQLDRFKNLLSGGGLQVEINSASEQGSGVVGRLEVTQR